MAYKLHYQILSINSINGKKKFRKDSLERIEMQTYYAIMNLEKVRNNNMNAYFIQYLSSCGGKYENSKVKQQIILRHI